MTAIKTGFIQFFNPITGKPVANGYVATYENGGGMPKPTFSDLAEKNQNQNPAPLDASGSAAFFGSGAYTFVVRDSNGAIVSTLNDLGLDQAGNNVPSSETPIGSIGSADDQFDGDDYTIIYDSTGAVVAKTKISTAWIAGALKTGSILGNYDAVTETMAEGGGTPPLGSIVVGGPQEQFDDLSTRLYQLTGNPNINPESDSGVGDSGKGDNWVDLMRLAASEEIRTKRLVGRWDEVKNIISAGTITYPIMVFGSDGILYKTTGSPSAGDIIGTDPVGDTAHAVWAAVYDPTLTAAYPPGYRSPETGIFYNSSTSIRCPIQYQKLKNAAGEFVNDGVPTEVFYKNTSANWAYGAGTTGSPAGGSAVGSLGAATGWYQTWMIKTESGLIDYTHTNLSLTQTLILVNGLDVGNGRTWSYGRRVGSFYVSGGVISRFKRSGNFYTLRTSTVSSGITANGDTNVAVFAPPSEDTGTGEASETTDTGLKFRAVFTVYGTVVHNDAASLPIIKLLGYDDVAGGQDFSLTAYTEHDVNYKSTAGAEYTRIVNGSSQIVFSMSGNAWHTFYVKSTGFIDPLTD